MKELFPIPFHADMQRAVPADSGAGTSSYWVMPSNTTIPNFSIFWNGAHAELIHFPISAAMFSMMFQRLMWTNFVYYILVIRIFLSLSVNLTSHFSNFADFRQLQIPNAQKKYCEILPAHTKTLRYTTHKITNRYFEFKYHFLTLQKKIPITFEQGCTMPIIRFQDNWLKKKSGIGMIIQYKLFTSNQVYHA